MSLLADEAMYFGAVADGVESQQEEIAELRQQLAEAQAEVLEQARIVGMSGEREIALRQQVGLLRDEVTRCRDWFETQANVTSKGGPSSWELMLLRDERDAADKALAATEPKP